MKRLLRLACRVAGLVLAVSLVFVIVLIGRRLHFGIQRKLLADVEAVLTHYNQTLAAGEGEASEIYSPRMQALIQNRRQFYAEYLEIGLKSHLVAITADFDFVPRQDVLPVAFARALFTPGSTSTWWDVLSGRAVTVPYEAQVRALQDGYYTIQVTEMVTLSARYAVPPEQHPVVLAAQWALGRTKDPGVRQQLEEHRQGYLEDTRKSYEDGYELVHIIYHRLLVKYTPTTLQIVEDTFTDQDAIFAGFDAVMWVDGEFVRNTAGVFDTMEARMYQKPVEDIGRGLLWRYGVQRADD